MSLNITPGLGKSGTSRMYDFRSMCDSLSATPRAARSPLRGPLPAEAAVRVHLDDAERLLVPADDQPQHLGELLGGHEVHDEAVRQVDRLGAGRPDELGVHAEVEQHLVER